LRLVSDFLVQGHGVCESVLSVNCQVKVEKERKMTQTRQLWQKNKHSICRTSDLVLLIAVKILVTKYKQLQYLQELASFS